MSGSSSDGLPPSNVVQASLSPPVHNFVFLVTFVFLAVWLVKAAFRARTVWKLYRAVTKYNVVRINDAHPHHMRQADVLAVVRNRSSHTMHVVDAVRLRFHVLDQSVKVVADPKDADAFLLRFTLHVDPATCAQVAVDVFAGVSTSAVRDFYKVFASSKDIAKAVAKKKKKQQKAKEKSDALSVVPADAAGAGAAAAPHPPGGAAHGTVIAVAPKRGSMDAASAPAAAAAANVAANTTTKGGDDDDGLAPAYATQPLPVLARSKLELVTFPNHKLWGKAPTLIVKAGLKQDIEVRVPKDWFAQIGAQHATKYPLAIRVTDVDAPPAPPGSVPSAAFAGAHHIPGASATTKPSASGLGGSGGAGGDRKEGAGADLKKPDAGASFSSSAESASQSGVSASSAGAMSTAFTVPCYGVELTILQLTTRPGEYGEQIARARASVAAAAAARAVNPAPPPPAAAAPGAADSKAIELTRVGASAPAPADAAAGAAPAAGAAAAAVPAAAAAGAAGAGGALAPVIVARPELEKLLVDAKVDQQLVFTDRAFLTCLDIYGLDEDSVECIACLTDPKDVILLPCRHVNVCHNCFDNLKICPLCRAPILNHMRFMSGAAIAAAEARLAYAHAHPGAPPPKTPPVLHPHNIAVEVDEKRNSSAAVAAPAAGAAAAAGGSAGAPASAAAATDPTAHPLHNPNLLVGAIAPGDGGASGSAAAVPDHFPPEPQPLPPGMAESPVAATDPAASAAPAAAGGGDSKSNS